MVLEVSYVYNKEKIIQLQNVIKCKLLFISGDNMNIQYESNDFASILVSLNFEESNKKPFQLNLKVAPYYYCDIINDDVAPLRFFKTPIYMGNEELHSSTPKLPCLLTFKQPLEVSKLKIYGIQRKRKWDYEKKLSYFKEIIEMDVYDYYEAVIFYVFEFQNGLNLMLLSNDRGIIEGTFNPSKINDHLSWKFNSEELDLGAMEKYYSHPKFPDNIPPDAYSTDVNKYVLLHQFG